ncbi:hypothetical protein [Photobacterium leiognathi]|uniref:hypothetical protein n=1 Tax=Photobacterium leiognathi TaxID=553611 RepID=UPI0029814D95|nr:hypothetical protein [Photobacterium leiognathi]
MLTRIIKELFNVSFILALFTSVLYIAGSDFNYGYLKALSIPSDLFKSSFYETLENGFTMIYLGGIYTVIPAVFISFILYLYIYLIGEISLIPIVRKIVINIPLKNKVDGDFRKPKIILKLIKVSFLFLIFTITLFIIGFLLYQVNVFASEQGFEAATRELEKAKIDKDKTNIVINNKTILGSILKCSSTHCAIYDKTRNGIIIYPINSIISIEVTMK